MCESVPIARYSPDCNVLRQWKTSLILTYRFYRLYDIYKPINIAKIQQIQQTRVGSLPLANNISYTVSIINLKSKGVKYEL